MDREQVRKKMIDDAARAFRDAGIEVSNDDVAASVDQWENMKSYYNGKLKCLENVDMHQEEENAAKFVRFKQGMDVAFKYWGDDAATKNAINMGSDQLAYAVSMFMNWHGCEDPQIPFFSTMLMELYRRSKDYKVEAKS